MTILGRDYLDTLKHMVTGQSFKVPHKGCSDSRCLSLTMDVKGYVMYCFKCEDKGFLPHEDSTFRDRKRREAEKAAFKQEREREGYDLPSDFGHNIENAGLSWLGTGGWTSRLIFKHMVGWSSRLQRVIFPLKPIGWQGRAVHDDQVPKYLSKTLKGSYWLSDAPQARLCVVEDILSAGRVGDFMPTLALLGTDSVPWDILMKRREVFIWTDNDKAGQKCRRNIHDKLQWVPGIRVLDIESGKDPKKYSNAEIQDRLQRGGA